MDIPLISKLCHNEAFADDVIAANDSKTQPGRRVLAFKRKLYIYKV